MTSGQFQHIPVDQIWIDRESRQRRELKNIEELAASIRDNGLIHPPVITREFQLIAGERRLTAVRSLGWSTIPIQWVDEIDPILLHALELEENVKRVDLSWQEECDAVKRYHELRASTAEGWSTEKTAEALGMQSRTVNRKLAVAKAIDEGNERVASAPKYSTALGIIERENVRKKNVASASLASIVMDEKPEPVDLSVPRKTPLRNEDFHEWALAYDGPKFNFLHCDFPYGVNADRHAQGQAAAQGGYADSPDVYWALLSTLEMAMSNVVAESAHMMFWFSMDYYTETKARLEAMGWKVNPFPLIWFKNDNTGILPDPKRGPRRVYETAFLCLRGDQLIVNAVANTFAHPGRDKSVHMSEKPRPMLRHFFRMFVDEYTYMLDPTAGSGNAVRVAEDMGAKRLLGLERDEEFFNRATEAYYNDEVDL